MSSQNFDLDLVSGPVARKVCSGNKEERINSAALVNFFLVPGPSLGTYTVQAQPGVINWTSSDPRAQAANKTGVDAPPGMILLSTFVPFLSIPLLAFLDQ